MGASRTWSSFPSVDGTFTVDPAECERLAANFGRHARGCPGAVLCPSSVADVRAALRWSHAHGVPVAARGEAHSTFTQTAVEGGLLVDMRGLSGVSDRDDDSVWVQSGARWSELVERTAAGSVYPPVLTDYLGLSVGGTLSVGGIGGESFRCGAQVDNVLELDVVTAQGDLVRCSAVLHSELFDLCRGGLGQFGIITAARVPLIHRAPGVISSLVRCSTLEVFLSVMNAFEQAAGVDHLYGNISVAGDGSSRFEVVATEYALESRASSVELTTGVTAVERKSRSFHEFAHRVEGYASEMQRSGAWGMAHPWLDVFVPSDVAPSVVAESLASLPDSAARPVDMLVYPLRRSVLRAPMLRVPARERFILFDVLYSAATLEAVEAVLRANEQAYDSCAALGGTLYPIGSTPMSLSRWRGHYGEAFAAVSDGKRRWDPKGILGRGAATVPFGVPPARV